MTTALAIVASLLLAAAGAARREDAVAVRVAARR
jgi:hypothetical protein